MYENGKKEKIEKKEGNQIKQRKNLRNMEGKGKNVCCLECKGTFLTLVLIRVKELEEEENKNDGREREACS